MISKVKENINSIHLRNRRRPTRDNIKRTNTGATRKFVSGNTNKYLALYCQRGATGDSH